MARFSIFLLNMISSSFLMEPEVCNKISSDSVVAAGLHRYDANSGWSLQRQENLQSIFLLEVNDERNY
jgi:hypothetical protein